MALVRPGGRFSLRSWAAWGGILVMDMMVAIIVVIIGACVGSFITAASWRLPRGVDVVVKPSHCPKCSGKLGVRDLVPVFSWLWNRGKCRNCEVGVSVRYIATEVMTALVFAGLYYEYGLIPQFYILCLLATSLLILIISDFETYIMPDSTTIAAFVLGLIYHYYNGWNGWPNYLAGFAVGLLVALGLRYGFYWITKREGFGMGDVKFLPVAGLWVGFAALPAYFLIAGVLGVVTGLVWKAVFRNPEYPFGPALAAALMVVVVFPAVDVFSHFSG